MQSFIYKVRDNCHYDDDGGNANDVRIVRDNVDELLLRHRAVESGSDAHEDAVPESCTQ